jgi:hypothetical protein
MFQVVLGSVAGVLAVVQYVPYIADVLRGKTKPHAFSWFVWSVPTAIVFAAQVWSGGGAGAWATGISVLMCTAIFALCFFRGERTITRFDWLCLGISMIALALWAVTKEPLGAVILVTIADLLGFGPTIRKSFAKPYEETLNTYLLSGIKWTLSIAALSVFDAITLTYPIAMILGNWGFVAFLIIQRKKLLLT